MVFELTKIITEIGTYYILNERPRLFVASKMRAVVDFHFCRLLYMYLNMWFNYLLLATVRYIICQSVELSAND